MYMLCVKKGKSCKACDEKGSAASNARDGLLRVERGR